MLLFLPQQLIKYWYDDHSYQKSLQVAMDTSIGLNQMLSSLSLGLGVYTTLI